MSANKDLSYALYQVCQLFQSIHGLCVKPYCFLQQSNTKLQFLKYCTQITFSNSM